MEQIFFTIGPFEVLAIGKPSTGAACIGLSYSKVRWERGGLSFSDDYG